MSNSVVALGELDLVYEAHEVPEVFRPILVHYYLIITFEVSEHRVVRLLVIGEGFDQ